MGENSLWCDDKLHWLKIGEEQAWLVWDENEAATSKISCGNYPGVRWEDVNLPGNTSCEYLILPLWDQRH